MVFAELNKKPGQMVTLSSLTVSFESYSCGRDILWSVVFTSLSLHLVMAANKTALNLFLKTCIVLE